MHSVLHTVLHDVLCKRDASGSQSPRRWEDEPPRTSPGPMTGRTSGLGMTGRGLLPVLTAWAVPGHADAPGWLISPAASPRELGFSLAPETRHTAARLSCSSVRCWGGQLGDCSPDTNRLAGHEQRLDRKMRQDRGNSTAIAFGSVPRASGGLVRATRCRADVSVMTASAAPRARRRGRRSKRGPRHRSVRLRSHRVRLGRTVVCHQIVAKRSGDIRPAWVPRTSTGPRWGE